MTPLIEAIAPPTVNRRYRRANKRRIIAPTRKAASAPRVWVITIVIALATNNARYQFFLRWASRSNRRRQSATNARIALASLRSFEETDGITPTSLIESGVKRRLG